MSEPAVSREDVEHVAELARIDLSSEEAEQLREDFAEILGYFDRLEEVPDVDHETEHTNIVRSDEAEACLDQSEALANADETEDGYFIGPPVS